MFSISVLLIINLNFEMNILMKYIAVYLHDFNAGVIKV